ncbi:hypothetical protein ACIQXW_23450 [Lysinibacillus sp. NPDC097162]|uniref:hypothetical protein n=1 Tax=Lysinibacillus sp. NPDC097162 TaxID=3364140 RepID=UPI0038309DCF
MNIDGNFPSYEQQEAIKTSIDNVNTQIANKNAGKILKSKTYTSNGTFTVPAGVTEIYITGGGAGGGGAGGGGTSHGTSGGVVSIGSLFTLSGGSGGVAGNAGAAAPSGGPGGSFGGPPMGSVRPDGGSGGWYSGGLGSTVAVNASTEGGKGAYCSGGGGCGGSGGGAGDFVIDKEIIVTPSAVYNITVGVGGLGGSYNSSGYTSKGGRGGDGILTVKWWE